MNEILAIIYSLLVLDYFKVQQFFDEKSPNFPEDTFEVLQEFQYLHDLNSIRADSYTIFAKILDLGVKDFFYKDKKQELDNYKNFEVFNLI